MGVTFQDYYKILGVDRTATDKEIKAAYRKLARQWHPDLHSANDKEDAEEKFKLINEAHEVLSDPEKRSKYDQLGADWRSGQDFHPPPDMDGFRYYSAAGEDMSDFSDFFASIFGDGRFRHTVGRNRHAVSLRGQDLESLLEISVEEAYRGGEKSIQLAVGEATKTLSVKIPPGVHDDSRIRLKGQGGQGVNGGANGDLYLKIRLLPHQLFKVNGNDIETEVFVRPEQAVLGDLISVPTLDGTVAMKLPAGSQTGLRLRLRGKGLPQKEGRGDEYVRIRIDIPSSLSEQEVQLYRQLAALSKNEAMAS